MWRGDQGLAGRWRDEGETEEQSWARHQKTLLPQGIAQTPQDMGQLAVYLASAVYLGDTLIGHTNFEPITTIEGGRIMAFSGKDTLQMSYS